MQFAERQLQERIGTVLHRLASLEQSLSSAETRKQADRVVGELRKIKAELDRAFLEAQEAAGACRDWRSSAEKAQHRADLLFLLSPVPTLLIERSGSVLDANPSAARTVNTSHRHLLGKPFHLYMAADRDAFLARLQSIVQGEPAVRWPATIRPRERSPMQVVLSAVADSEDRLLVMLLAADSSERDAVQNLDDEVNAQPA
jgi:PAS domain S-box-containing protein